MLKLSILSLALFSPTAHSQPKCPSALPASGAFAAPVSVACALPKRVQFLTPRMTSLGDQTSGTKESPKNFFTETLEENWFEYKSESTPAEAAETAALTEAGSREELNRIVKARCQLFLASPSCKNVKKEEALDCSGSAEAILKSASDFSSDKDKAKVAGKIFLDSLRIDGKITFKAAAYVAFMQIVRLLEPKVGYALDAYLTGSLINKELKSFLGDAEALRQADPGMDWAESLKETWRDRELTSYCYQGKHQFPRLIQDALRSAPGPAPKAE